jgi:hypothetical protein
MNLKVIVNGLISEFFDVVIDQNRIQNYESIKNEDYDRAAQAEKLSCKIYQNHL